MEWSEVGIKVEMGPGWGKGNWLKGNFSASMCIYFYRGLFILGSFGLEVDRLIASFGYMKC